MTFTQDWHLLKKLSKTAAGRGRGSTFGIFVQDTNVLKNPGKGINIWILQVFGNTSAMYMYWWLICTILRIFNIDLYTILGSAFTPVTLNNDKLGHEVEVFSSGRDYERDLA